jgi:hypothetical protein
MRSMTGRAPDKAAYRRKMTFRRDTIASGHCSGDGGTAVGRFDISAVYQDLHGHPGLPFGETRTAGVVTSGVGGGEQVGVPATSARAALVFWLFGGADPAAFTEATDRAAIERVMGGPPSNHSPRYAPVPEPTARIGVDALARAARAWLGDTH